MSKIGFLTDSCSDIPQELADKYGIEVVGFPINLDGKEYMERKDFTNDQFYQMMRDAQGVPTTAAITQRMLVFLLWAGGDHNNIVSIQPQLLGNSKADAVGSAGDQSDLAGQVKRFRGANRHV